MRGFSMQTYQDMANAGAEVLAGYLTLHQLAAQLGISPRTLLRWHAQRMGPPRCVVGRLIRYRVDAVRAWMASREQEARPSPRRRR